VALPHRLSETRPSTTMTSSILLPRSLPAAQGVSASGILEFLQAIKAENLELHSLIIVRHGHVVAEGQWTPYRAGVPHTFYSLSKSFASTAAGFAVAEGLISVSDKVISFFPDKLPAEISKNLAAMTIKDLLTMTTGHDQCATVAFRNATDGDWTRGFLAQPVEFEPGTHFVYNSGATYLVAAIVEKVTGQSLTAYLAPRLFDPLGIAERYWELAPNGVAIGGWGFYGTTETIAKFGLMYLNDGVFQGRRVLPDGWVAEATSWQVSNGTDPENDWHQGYGYQFWRCRHGAYRGDGALGQYCVVMPEQDMVVGITSGLNNMGAVLNLIWKHLLTAALNSTVSGDDQVALDQHLASLEITRPAGSGNSELEGALFERDYYFTDENPSVESLRFEGDAEAITVTIHAGGQSHIVRAGRGRWLAGTTTLKLDILKPHPEIPDYVVGACAAWDGEKLGLRIAYLETPFSALVTVTFDGAKATVHVTKSVAFGPMLDWTGVGVASAGVTV